MEAAMKTCFFIGHHDAPLLLFAIVEILSRKSILFSLALS